MIAPAALQFGQQFFASLIQTGAVGPAAQAIVSPLSVWFALLLLLNGAGVPSKTYTELYTAVTGSGPSSTSNSTTALLTLNAKAAALQGTLSEQAGDANKLSTANALWTKGISLNPGYVQQMKSFLGAEAASVTSVAPINAWAARATNNMIQQVLDPGTPFDMVVTNAVYFKGMWEYPFATGRTAPRDFNALSKDGARKVVKVPMMSRLFNPGQLRAAQKVAYAEVPGKFRGVRLPYKGSSGLAAVLVLPDPQAYKSVFDAATTITGQMVLDGTTWARLTEELQLSVPRFRVAVNQLKLVKALQAMGIRTPFDAAQANFKLATSSPLFLTDMLQSAVVQVDEAGTEAAAVTVAVGLKSAAVPTQPKTLVFDRPFLFFIVEGSSQSVLFQGVVTDPSAGAQ